MSSINECVNDFVVVTKTNLKSDYKSPLLNIETEN